MTCIGQRRSGRLIAGKGRYLWIGILGIGISSSQAHREVRRYRGMPPTGHGSATAEPTVGSGRFHSKTGKSISERKHPELGRATTAARRPLGRRAAKSK